MTIKRLSLAFVLVSACSADYSSPVPSTAQQAVKQEVQTDDFDNDPDQTIIEMALRWTLASTPVNPSSNSSLDLYYPGREEAHPENGMFFEVHSPALVWPYTQRGYSIKIVVNYNNNLTDPLIGGIGFPGDHISLWFDGPAMTGASYSQFTIYNDNASGVESAGWSAVTTMVISDITEAEDPQFSFTADDVYNPVTHHNCWGDWPRGDSSNVGTTDVLAWYTTADWAEHYAPVQQPQTPLDTALNPAVSGGPTGANCNLAVGTTTIAGEPWSHLTWYAGH